MLIKPLLALIALITIVMVVRHIRSQKPKKRPKLILKYGLYLLAIILVILVITGRVHWITAGIAAVIPFIFKMSTLAMRFLPMMQFWRSAKKQQEQFKQGPSTKNYTGGKMTVKQAKEIFGLDEVNSVEQVTKRHKELMQKNHPDRGGSDFLAAQINHAKEVLIEHIKK